MCTKKLKQLDECKAMLDLVEHYCRERRSAPEPVAEPKRRTLMCEISAETIRLAKLARMKPITVALIQLLGVQVNAETGVIVFPGGEYENCSMPYYRNDRFMWEIDDPECRPRAFAITIEKRGS